MDITIKKLTGHEHEAWDQYLDRSEASIYHDSRWPSLIKTVFGHDSYHLMAIRNNQIVGVLPLVQLRSLLFGNFLVSMPYFNYGGVVSDTDDVTNELLKAAHDLRMELGCSHIEFRFETKMETDLAIKTDKVTMLLKLPSEPDELWQAIGSKRRAQIKRPIREGVEFIHGGEELLEDFYTVFSRNMRDLGTPVYGKVFFKEILKTFSNESSIAVVRLNGKPVGAGFLIGHKGKLEIPWASTLREFNRIGVNMFLYWNILKTAIENGYQVFDFGRSSKDANTLKFKKQWGGEEKPLYWYYDINDNQSLPGLNPENSKYKVAINLWKKIPVGLSRMMGPHIVKSLP